MCSLRRQILHPSLESSPPLGGGLQDVIVWQPGFLKSSATGHAGASWFCGRQRRSTQLHTADLELVRAVRIRSSEQRVPEAG
jgi:hypothetical protein